MTELDTLIIKGSKSLPLYALFGTLRAAGYQIKATGPGEVTAIPPPPRTIVAIVPSQTPPEAA